MQKQQLFDLQEGDCIYVYSGGHLEAQGRYIGVIKDKNESFLCWTKHNGNEVYTNLNGISVETMNENTAYLQNTKETCERGYGDNQNTDNTSQPNYDNYNQNANGMYDDTYDSGYNNNQNTSYNYDPEYNTYNRNMENTYNQSYDNHNPKTNNYNQYPNDMYPQEYTNDYNQNSGCTCNQGYNNTYPK
ncbi:hypothetical protein BK784_35745 [Bacillus thuringiensis serovar medellin]|uniref:Uncharacterized protein n=1 Tax=Bacillus thuringiensis subsp. medellin TaxID=79672 RepID=A0A9X6MXT2_BACTV|nr:hypothetical protein [Bacillus thuringiensis]OUB84292.1 hypothetical protein BK784_35745 [Bacillus thuringiensis serovar medellin]